MDRLEKIRDIIAEPQDMAACLKTRREHAFYLTGMGVPGRQAWLRATRHAARVHGFAHQAVWEAARVARMLRDDPKPRRPPTTPSATPEAFRGPPEPKPYDGRFGDPEARRRLRTK